MKIKLFSILAAIILVLCTISSPIFINNANGAINASSNTIKEQSFSTGSKIMDQILKITELNSINPLCHYTLTVNIDGNGIVNLDPPGGYYLVNTEVTLTAIPDMDWTFSHWSGDLSGSNNPETIIMDSDKVVTAHFSQEEYFILSVVIEGSGSVVLDPLGGSYLSGTVVNLTAVADSGWFFNHWGGDLQGNKNPENITMDSDKTVIANFSQEEYTLEITYSGTGSGSVEVDPEGPYHYGDVVDIEAIADEGSYFVEWGGDHSGSTNPDTIIIVGDMTIDARFDLEDNEPPKVTITKPKSHRLYVNNIPRRLFLLDRTEIVGPITIKASASDNESASNYENEEIIDRVEFYIDKELKETVKEKPYQYTWRPKITERGKTHTIKVIAYDLSNNEDEAKIQVNAGRIIRIFHNHPHLTRLGLLLLILTLLTSGSQGGGSTEGGENQAPIASINIPSEGEVGSSIVFDGRSSYDLEQGIITYEWDFGDGNTGTGESPTHIYKSPGEYTITLKVTDNEGEYDIITNTITIYNKKTDMVGAEIGENPKQEASFMWYGVGAIISSIIALLCGLVLRKKKFI